MSDVLKFVFKQVDEAVWHWKASWAVTRSASAASDAGSQPPAARRIFFHAPSSSGRLIVAGGI
jgi:hypothetical protein